MLRNWMSCYGLLTVVALALLLGAIRFEDRKVNTIKYLCGGSKWTNERQWRDDAIEVVKRSAEDALAKPKLVSSVYYPGEPKEGKVMLLIAWLELVPTLSEVTLRNPATGKEATVSIPREYLNQLRSGRHMDGVLYCYIEYLPVEFTGTDPQQKLEAYCKGSDAKAVLYPSLRPPSEQEDSASTQPATRPTE